MSAVTQAHGFCMPDGKPLFAVKSGIPVADALEQASILLSSLTRLMLEERLTEDERNAAQYLLEMTHALVKACLAGLWETEKAS